ncbi:MAG: hypothetical protein AAGJ35_11240, partial [Myxococcota bacterium]
NRRKAKRYNIDFIDAIIGVLYSGEMDKDAIHHGIRKASICGVQRLEVLTHVGQATPEEMQRWPGPKHSHSFPLSENRQMEWNAIEEIGGNHAL